MYKISYDTASPTGDYSCEIIYKINNDEITVLAEKINGRTTANVRFAFYKMLTKISKLTSYIRRTLCEIILLKEKKMKCPKCGSKEIDAETPYTVYRCGSRDYDQRPNTFIQSSDCKEYEKGKKLFTKIKYAFKIIFGKLRCSGYGVYPNGIKCFGCSDCKKVK